MSYRRFRAGASAWIIRIYSDREHVPEGGESLEDRAHLNQVLCESGAT